MVDENTEAKQELAPVAVEAAAEKKLSGARMRQLALIKNGLCPMCGDENDRPGKRCSDCQIKAREYAQRKHGHKPWVKGQRGRPPVVSYAADTPVEA